MNARLLGRADNPILSAIILSYRFLSFGGGGRPLVCRLFSPERYPIRWQSVASPGRAR